MSDGAQMDLLARIEASLEFMNDGGPIRVDFVNLREVLEGAREQVEACTAALEAAQMGLRYAVRVWVLSDEIAWSEEEIDETVERIIGDAKKEAMRTTAREGKT